MNAGRVNGSGGPLRGWRLGLPIRSSSSGALDEFTYRPRPRIPLELLTHAAGAYVGDSPCGLVLFPVLDACASASYLSWAMVSGVISPVTSLQVHLRPSSGAATAARCVLGVWPLCTQIKFKNLGTASDRSPARPSVDRRGERGVPGGPSARGAELRARAAQPPRRRAPRTRRPRDVCVMGNPFPGPPLHLRKGVRGARRSPSKPVAAMVMVKEGGGSIWCPTSVDHAGEPTSPSCCFLVR